MIRIIAPEKVHACIKLPSSKSISNRVIIINALGKGGSLLGNISDCDDTKVIIKALTENSETKNVQAAGTAMRFLTAYYSMVEGEWIITGTQRMKQRPISILVDALRELGANISYIEKEGFPPLFIRGKKLSGNQLVLKGDVSSQYISALLMIAPLLDRGLTLQMIGEIISRPYIDQTLKLMQEFGIIGKWLTKNCIQINPKSYENCRFTVEGDWSAASYWYEIVALSNDARIELLGLSQNSLQGDCKVAEIFRLIGVESVFTKNGVQLHKTTHTIDLLEYDFTEQPDLVQTLVVTCAMKHIPFRFTGLKSLRIKETDRIVALTKELSKLGFVIKYNNDDLLYWDGNYTGYVNDTIIDTYEDHRMAMAFAPVCLIYKEIKINHPDVVSKSYPKFWKDLVTAGFIMT